MFLDVDDEAVLLLILDDVAVIIGDVPDKEVPEREKREREKEKEISWEQRVEREDVSPDPACHECTPCSMARTPMHLVRWKNTRYDRSTRCIDSRFRCIDAVMPMMPMGEEGIR